jgi:tRNA 2-thiouridine synthesizing protein A
MAETRRGARNAAKRLDVIGLKCPLPVLKMQAALARLRPGQMLEVAATDPLAAIDIPHAAAGGGHHLVESSRDGAILRFMIRKGEA